MHIARCTVKQLFFHSDTKLEHLAFKNMLLETVKFGYSINFPRVLENF